MNIKNLLGKKFSLLTVVDGPLKRGTKTAWICKCECGKNHTVMSCNLMSGKTMSCGCHRKKIAKVMGENKATHGMHKSRTYKTWRSMLERCYNPNAISFPNYGAIGIRVCKKWRGSFEGFLQDMGERPPRTTIDRFPDKNGDYELSNCRWATWEEQNNNHSGNVVLEFSNQSKTIAQWCSHLGLREATVRSRIRRNWSTERALTTPTKH